MILRARTVVPVCRPPLADGAVVIEGGQVVAVGSWGEVRSQAVGEVLDLGEVTLLPGLVNPHCHLDYTDMAGHLPPPRSFTEWITGMLALKAQWSYSEYASSWIRGAGMLLRHGVTTVGDIEAVPELLPEVWQATPLRVISFLEMTGVRSAQQPEVILQRTLEVVESVGAGRSVARLSPHAPYSAPPHLLRLAAACSRERGWPCTVHVAESDEEFAMFRNAEGPMYDWLRRNGRDMSDCGRGTPIARLDALGVLSPGFVAVHVNCLGQGDAARLGSNGVHVVHCPRSHAYFQHRRFPLGELDAARVQVALGTDSLATVRCYRNFPVELDMFAEMRAFAATHPEISPNRILAMATMHGAAALGLGSALGWIGEGALADLVVLPVRTGWTDAEEAVVQYRGEAAGVMIAGEWVIRPPCLRGA